MNYKVVQELDLYFFWLETTLKERENLVMGKGRTCYGNLGRLGGKE